MKNVFYINLNERTDRKVRIEKILSDLNWQYERFSAIKDICGAIGCSKSHLKLLELAKERDLDYIVIVEDDLTITDMNLFKTQLDKFLNSTIEYDVLLLGGNSYPDPKYEYINDFCLRTFNCQTTIGYIVKRGFYDTMIENFKDGIQKYEETRNHRTYSCDMHWKKLQKEHKFIFLLPPTVTQIKGDKSDIANWYWDSDQYMLDVEKKWLGY